MDSPNVIQIHLDIETLGIDPNAVILSIGAVNNCTHEKLYLEVEPESQQPRTINLETLKWWLTQPIPIPLNGTCHLISALHSLSDYFRFLRPFSESKVEVWANGTDFDIVLLKDAYIQYEIPVPWKYNEVRDFRTVRKLFPEVQDSEKVNAHNALADAQWQMEHLNRIFKHLSNLKEPM